MTGKLCTIHDCYLDDSKDKRQETAHVCAGFYGTSEAWSDFSSAWNRQLEDEGLSYWKSSEHRGLEGQFARWKNLPFPMGRRAADLIRDRLQAVAMGTKGLYGTGIAVPVVVHAAILRHENANLIFPEDRPYHRAFELTLLHTARLACTAPRDLMLFIHDDGPDFGDLLTIFRNYKMANDTASRRLTSLLPMDDKETPALQLADMFANALQGASVRALTGQQLNIREQVFMLDRSRIGVWTKELGEEILWGNLKRRELPIPDDLNSSVLARKPHFTEPSERLRDAWDEL